MLTSVPSAINRAARQVTLRHPNAFDVTVYRKVLKRVEKDDSGADSTMGGTPTLGGMGVLRSEEEADYEYTELGLGKMMFAGAFEPQDFNEHDSALIAENARAVLIEAKAEPGAAGYFLADTTDLVMADLGMGVILSWEVATASGTVNVPPYTRKLIVNPRDDLNQLDPFSAG